MSDCHLIRVSTEPPQSFGFRRGISSKCWFRIVGGQKAAIELGAKLAFQGIHGIITKIDGNRGTSSIPQRLKLLGFRSYQKYLQSPHWADLRRRFFSSKLFIGKCWCCGSNGPLQLHHRTYKRLGAERLTDLVTLCGDCHKVTHTLVGSTSGTNIWNACLRARQQNS